MSKTLFINACVRECSRTFELAKHVINQISGEREDINLYDINLLPLDNNGMELREIASTTNDFSNDVFKFAKQFASADKIVIAAPYWDLMFPAVVKSYFEQVTVNGLTFTYGDNGIPKGLCKAKELIYVTTSGGPIFHNFGFDYVSALAKSFYGINDVKYVCAQGLDIHGADVNAILSKAILSIKDVL